MRKPRFPEGWEEGGVAELAAHYEGQSDEEAVTEDEAGMSGADASATETPSERAGRGESEARAVADQGLRAGRTSTR